MSSGSGAPKRLFTNSMLSTYRSCKARYRWVYIEQLAPMRSKGAFRYGDLSHLILKQMYEREQDPRDMAPLIETWVQDAVNHVKTTLKSDHWLNAMAPEEFMRIPMQTEAESRSTAADVLDLMLYYYDNFYKVDKIRWKVLWCEQRFEVPFVDRNDRRHKTWRFSGKWDLVVFDTYTGRVIIIDHKTTINKPKVEAINFQYSTQPIGYSYAGLYLATVPLAKDLLGITREDIRHNPDITEQATRAIHPDLPFWPRDIKPPSGFMVNVIRKKVPKKPEKLKTKTKDKKERLSKSKGIDTTYELYHEAITENKLDPADYKDVLDFLQKRGDTTSFREELSVGSQEIIRWVQETRTDLEKILIDERDPKANCTRNPSECNVFSLCPYHALCWGDEDMARALFRHRPLHNELWT